MNERMQRAIEFLTREYERVGFAKKAAQLRISRNELVRADRAIAAITAALRAVPEGFVLVRSGAVKPSNCGAAHHHCCQACGADLGGIANQSEEQSNG